ncbi:Radial spoke head protein 3 [Phytophthora boehmeriae]|uniref:Radial spoke head protein 3 n=1 Tax=Phytophthora boehmeriae TaxID=109152 RepID=A0A8T1XEX1_9STRA|nr:Radial spoke head protein 3 [Phytophthora boehmeriae]
MDQDLSYSYSSKPRAVQTNRSKARDGGVKPIPPNIMHDPRIPRGSVFAPVNSARNNDVKEKGKKRRGISTTKKISNNKTITPGVFEARSVSSYGFTSISLEANLVEQTQPTTERESFSQTDAFITPSNNQRNSSTNDAFLRPKIGIDTSTQIEESDGLFNFDVEVMPLLNVLVNKTLAQALLEVKEEQEIRLLHGQHEALKSDKSDVQQEERELEEKAKEAQRREELIKKKKAEDQQRDRVMREKLFAWQLARPLASQAISLATSTLYKKGVFYDPILRDLALWLQRDIYEDADAKIRLRYLSSQLLDELIVHGLRRQTVLANLLPNESQAMVRLLLREPIVLPLPADADVDTAPISVSVIGPIDLSRNDSLETIESKIEAWLAEHLGYKTIFYNTTREGLNPVIHDDIVHGGCPPTLIYAGKLWL